MTAQEALAGFFQSVADAFLDMAAQIIAKWITMTILNSVLSLFPGGGGGKLSNLSAPSTISNPLGDLSGIGLPYKATGGPVAGGMPYIVGEKGPELFMPGRSGAIVPNNALGGGSTNVVVNVDASGNSNVQGDQAQAKQLGVVVSAAVQAELVKQQRPGGLLAGTRR
jgi:phage-related minor tail protein